jgi:UDP-glucose 6-dehydrogenase
MTLKLSVVGTGYLGATHAACMSSLGFTVVGVDTDAQKIAQLSRGELPSLLCLLVLLVFACLACPVNKQ